MSLDGPLNRHKINQQKINRQKILDAITQNGSELGILPEFAHIKPQLDIQTFTSVPSTSTHLWDMLRKGEASSGSAIIAQHQSAGRGQRGRTWQSSMGGLYLSLALEPNWSVTHSAQLTCLSAWGITTALNNLGIEANIKWPNDILYKGKKLGGILTETKLSNTPSPHHPKAQPPKTLPSATRTPKTTITQAVIGVGINWHNPVPQTGISLITILREDKSLEIAKNKINCLEVLIALVLRGIIQGVIFQQRVGSQVFMKAYQKLLTQVGQTVSLDSSGKLSLASPAKAPLANRSSSAQAANTQTTNTQTANAHLSYETESNGSIADIAPSRSANLPQTDITPWANRSGEVIGVSEEGYLEVALHHSNQHSSKHTKSHPASAQEEILQLKPSEIHIS